MSVDVTPLQRLTPHQHTAPPVCSSLVDLGYGRVVAVDQSLAACGLAVICHDAEGLRVQAAITLHTEGHGRLDHETDLARCWELSVLVQRWLADTLDRPHRYHLVYEAVPSGGGRLMHTGSSLLAAAALRFGAGPLRVALPVPARAHKRFVCGDANAKKSVHHAALKSLATSLPIDGFGLVTNEAIRDSVSVGLTHLYRGARP